MRTTVVMAGATWLAFSLGCVAFSDQTGALALDYEIDRVLVPAIRLVPPIAVQGEAVTIEALVLSPTEIGAVRVDVCGLDPSLPATIYGYQCFDNDVLVQSIGSSLPAVWDVPLVAQDCSFDTADVDTGSSVACSSTAPLRISAESGDDLGMGAIDVRLVRTGRADVPALADAQRELSFEGTPSRGEDLGLVYRVDWDGELEFRWYVDAGELHHTGRTATTWLQGGRHTTRNQLNIPTGYVGPLRVVVVVTEVFPDDDVSGNVAWDVLTLEVQ